MRWAWAARLWRSAPTRTYPPAAAKKEVVFSYTGLKAERIVTLRPDLIVAAAGIVSPQQVTKLRSLHLAVLVLDPHNLNDIYHDIALVGQATGKATAADLVVAGMKTRVAILTRQVARAATHPRVYYELDATGGYYTAGPGSYIDTLVRLAGGTNIAGTARVSYVKLNAEALLTANPQVILLGDAAYGTTVAAVAKRAGWSRISAVAGGRVYPINDDLVSRPGPRIIDGLETIAHLVHPELFCGPLDDDSRPNVDPAAPRGPVIPGALGGPSAPDRRAKQDPAGPGTIARATRPNAARDPTTAGETQSLCCRYWPCSWSWPSSPRRCSGRRPTPA